MERRGKEVLAKCPEKTKAGEMSLLLGEEGRGDGTGWHLAGPQPQKELREGWVRKMQGTCRK